MITCVVIVLIIYPASLLANTKFASIFLTSPSYEESLVGEVKTSVVKDFYGFQAISSTVRNIKNSLTVFGLSTKDRTICLIIQSIDGRYYGEAVFSPPRNVRNLHIFLPIRKLNSLDIPRRLLAIRVYASTHDSHCDSAVDPILVAGWGEMEKIQKINILSLGQGAQYMHVRSQTGKYVSCENFSKYTDSGRTISRFDYFCALPNEKFCELGDYIFLERESFGISTPSGIRSIRGNEEICK